MGPFKFSILALCGATLIACQEEAGFDARFPPVGGGRSITMPDAGMPTPLTPEGEGIDGTTEDLSAAVNAALANSNPNTGAPAGGVDNLDPNTGEGIASDSGVLNLAEQSQAEQLRLREADAAALAAAAAQRVVIQPGQMPDVVSNVNIITFARETSNSVGQRVYRRPNIRRTNSSSQCRKFNSADNAQRNFLSNGGPQDDPLNLDPDGDGFACRWSPDAYRALVLN